METVPSSQDQRVSRVMLVDDDDLVRKSLARQLCRQGFDVLQAEDGRAALRTLESEHVDVAVVDLEMPGMRGHEVIRRIRQASPRTECVLLTAHGDASDAFEALNAGASDYFTKPIDDWPRFTQILKKAIEVRDLKDQLRSARQEQNFQDLIGRSPNWRKLTAQIQDFSAYDLPVFITGESGSGKERVARAIHASSSRSAGPFLAVNCAAVPENLWEDKFFGHEKGAFNGADRRQAGIFEAATNGTVFLDEIGDMPVSAQPKLLRVLQEREVVRLGGQHPIRVNARIVAATHQDVKVNVGKGSFREDLYYRLNVLEIAIPPLRERKEDIPLLAYHFVRVFGEEYGKTVKSIDREALRLLTEYEWKNNVRELEHVITRAMVRVRGDTLAADLLELPGGRRAPASSGSAPVGLPAGMDPEWMELDYKASKEKFLEWFTVHYLVMRLRSTGWNITRAAELAGQQRPNFKKLMKRYGISRPDED
ncbi:MAG: sigma-54-dependent Fis family transcriptional regulator [Proteobacteria bacterium]|nr:sigma-54-dependent Fis family transcriptional regulator [Pseudomonadota bacterium]MCP4919305.1 sigma-54-dependent Fis family transcriptional regulator [Pseudomonadota bacterium]